MSELLRRPSLSLAAVSLSILGLAACSGGGGGGGSSDETTALEIVSFDGAGRTDVARNEPLEFTLSAPLDRDSVTPESLQVISGDDVVVGRYEVDGRILRFFPTVLPGDRDDALRADPAPINALGFQSATRYSVIALARSPFSLRSRGGRVLAQPLRAQFQTSGRFVVEQPEVAPQLLGGPAFDPEPLRPGGDPFGDPNDPDSLPLFDPANVSFTLRFTEPMDPASFSAFSTFSLVNVTPLDPGASCEVPGAGRPFPGRIDASADAREFTFHPLLSLGDRPDSGQPFVYRVTLSPAVTDLAGNSLADDTGAARSEPLVFHFATRNDPSQPNFQTVTEEFDQPLPASAVDPQNPHPALWTGNGRLEGAPVVRRVVSVEGTEASPCPPYCLLPQPLTPAGNRLQILYYRGDFNRPGGLPAEEESIIGMSWRPPTISNFLVAATYPRVTLKLGQSRLTLADPNGLSYTFDQNYQGFGADNPTTVFDGSYSVPNLLNVTWFAWPAFTRAFEYSGTTSIVWEANVQPGGGNIQAFRYSSSANLPRRRIFDAPDALMDTQTQPIGGENTVYFQQFTLAQKRSRIVSPFYDSGVTLPDYSGPIVAFDASRASMCSGSAVEARCFRVTWEGASADSSGAPDLANATGFDDSIDVADGHRFVRFAVDMQGDPFTGAVPSIETISFAYRTCGGR